MVLHVAPLDGSYWPLSGLIAVSVNEKSERTQGLRDGSFELVAAIAEQADDESLGLTDSVKAHAATGMTSWLLEPTAFHRSANLQDEIHGGLLEDDDTVIILAVTDCSPAVKAGSCSSAQPAEAV